MKKIEEKCNNSCCDVKPYPWWRVKFDYLMWEIHKHSHFLTQKFKHFIVNNIMFPMLRLLCDDNNYLIKTLKTEWKFGDFRNDELKNTLKSLLSMLYIIDYKRDSHNLVNNLNKFYNREALSPLKFTDDEFDDKCGFDDESQQNIRFGNVFRYSDGLIMDIDAISLKTKATYDIADEEKLLREYLYSLGCHSGWFWVYDEDNKSWTVYSCMQKVRMNRHYYKPHNVIVPCIEVLDSSDKGNDYICFIVNKKSIPSEFYEWYELYPIMDLPRKESEEETQKRINEVEEERKFLIDNHIEELLFRPVEPIKHIEKIECPGEDSTFYCPSFSSVVKVKNELIEAGCYECDICDEMVYREEHRFIVKNFPRNGSIIERIANKYSVRIDFNATCSK